MPLLFFLLAPLIAICILPAPDSIHPQSIAPTSTHTLLSCFFLSDPNPRLTHTFSCWWPANTSTWFATRAPTLAPSPVAPLAFARALRPPLLLLPPLLLRPPLPPQHHLHLQWHHRLCRHRHWAVSVVWAVEVRRLRPRTTCCFRTRRRSCLALRKRCLPIRWSAHTR
jgi:hypothetical protein